jgi:hypothetical protein
MRFGIEKAARQVWRGGLQDEKVGEPGRTGVQCVAISASGHTTTVRVGWPAWLVRRRVRLRGIGRTCLALRKALELPC